MAAHTLDKVILVTSLALAFALGMGILFVGWYSQLAIDEAKKTASHAPAPSLDVTCMPISHFSSEQTQHAESVCTSHFANYLKSTGTENFGISVAFPDIIPGINSSESDMPYFDKAKEIFQSNPFATGGGEPEGDPINFQLISTMPFLMILISILSFVLAIYFGQIAKFHGYFFNAAWSGAIGGSADAADDVAGDGGALLGKSDVIRLNLEKLSSSRSLAIGYLVFQLLGLLAWIILTAGAHHGSQHVMSMMNDDTQTEKSTDKGRDQAVNGVASSDVGPSTENVTYSDSGDFLCSMRIRNLGNVQRYTIQCAYEVSREPQPRQLDRVVLLTMWYRVYSSAMLYCLLVALIILIHIFLFFVVGPLCRRGVLLTVLKMTGLKLGGLGLGYGFTDLSVVASFSSCNGTVNRSSGERGTYPMKHIMENDKEV